MQPIVRLLILFAVLVLPLLASRMMPGQGSKLSQPEVVAPFRS